MKVNAGGVSGVAHLSDDIARLYLAVSDGYGLEMRIYDVYVPASDKDIVAPAGTAVCGLVVFRLYVKDGSRRCRDNVKALVAGIAVRADVDALPLIVYPSGIVVIKAVYHEAPRHRPEPRQVIAVVVRHCGDVRKHCYKKCGGNKHCRDAFQS